MPSETICTSFFKEYLDTQHSYCLEQEFSSQDKTDSAHLACRTKESAIQLTKNIWTSSKFSLPRERISITIENRQCTLCMPNKQSAIQLIKIIWSCKNSHCHEKEFPSRKKTDSAHHACLTKKSAIQLIKNIWISIKFQQSRARNFHHERNIKSTLCMHKKIICNPIDHKRIQTVHTMHA